jgi:hypothetical protein
MGKRVEQAAQCQHDKGNSQRGLLNSTGISLLGWPRGRTVGDGLMEVVGDGLVEVVGDGPLEVVGDGLVELVGDGLMEVVGAGLMEEVRDGLVEVVGDGLMQVAGDGLLGVVEDGLVEVVGDGLVEVVGDGLLGVGADQRVRGQWGAARFKANRCGAKQGSPGCRDNGRWCVGWEIQGREMPRVGPGWRCVGWEIKGREMPRVGTGRRMGMAYHHAAVPRAISRAWSEKFCISYNLVR